MGYAISMLVLITLLAGLGCTKSKSGDANQSRASAGAKKRPINTDGEIPGYLAETKDGRASVFVASSIANPAIHPITIDYVKVADGWVLSRALNQPAEVSIEDESGATLDLPGETRHRVYALTTELQACASVAVTVEVPASSSGGESKKLFIAADDLSVSHSSVDEWSSATMSMRLGRATIALVCLDAADEVPVGFTRAIPPSNPAAVEVIRDGASATLSWQASSSSQARYAIAYRPGSAPANCAEWYVEPSAMVASETSYVVEGLDPETDYGFRVCAVREGEPQSKGAIGVTGTQLALSSPAAAIALGAEHTCVIVDGGEVRAPGDVVCWGKNNAGQLGVGDNVTRCASGGAGCVASIPRVSLPDGEKATMVTAGGSHTCALLESGRVVCWGLNAYGQLGIGSQASQCNAGGTSCAASIPTVAFSAGRKAIQVAAGYFFTCALLEDYQIVCWGDNNAHQQGHVNEGFVHQTCDDGGPNCGLALKPVSFGASNFTPVKVSTGRSSTCAISDAGEIACWGMAEEGELGVGDPNSLSSQPESSCSFSGGVICADPHYPVLPSGAKAVDVTAGTSFACVRTDDGGIRCWGKNNQGQLGLGDSNNRCHVSSQADCVAQISAVDVPQGSSKSIMAGGLHACAVQQDDSVVCWGGNQNGRLGIGSTANQCNTGGGSCAASIPAISNVGDPFIHVAGYSATCGLTESRKLVCWGPNDVGQLGLGDTTERCASGGSSCVSSLPFIQFE